MRSYEYAPRAYELSKKQKHLIKGIAARTPIVMAGASQDMPRTELAATLDRFNYTDTFDRSGSTNKQRPALLEAMLGSSAKEARRMYLAGIGGVDDMVNLVRIATETAVYGEKANLPVFRVVMGATEAASLRSIGYPLPAMQIVQRMAGLGQNAYVQVVFAQKISSEMNGLDHRKVSEQQAKMIEGIKAVRRQLERGDNYSVETSVYDDTTTDTSKLDYYAECLLGTLSAEDVEALVKKGGDNNLVNSVKYAAAHYLIHDDPATELNLVSGPGIPTVRSFVDIGGLQESYFLGMRHKLAVQLGTEIKRPPFIFTRHLVPPYYLARDGDISLDECLVHNFRLDAIRGGDTAMRLDEFLTPGLNLSARVIGKAAMHDLVFMRDSIGLPHGVERPFPPLPYGASIHA